MSTLQVQVPEAYQIKEPLHQNTYLVNGQLKPWTGTTTNVYSSFLQQNRTNLLYWEAFLLWGRMKP